VVTAYIAIPSSGAVATVAIGTQLVWVGSGDGTVTGIDPATNTVRTTLRVGRGFQSLADDGAGTLWVASSPIPTSPSSPTPTSPSTILRVDVATGKSSPPLEAGQVTGVAFFDGALWVADRSRGSVLKVQ
jgi:DNA-binding beta-propeller fold protein YncE